MSSENITPLNDNGTNQARVYALLMKREGEAETQEFHASMGLKIFERASLKKRWKKLLNMWHKEDEANGEVWCSEELSTELKEDMERFYEGIEWSSDIERDLCHYLYRISWMHGFEPEEKVDIEVTPAEDTWEDIEHVRYVAYMLGWDYKTKRDFYYASIGFLQGTESRTLEWNVPIRGAERVKKALEEAGATVRLIPSNAHTEDKTTIEE